MNQTCRNSLLLFLLIVERLWFNFQFQSSQFRVILILHCHAACKQNFNSIWNNREVNQTKLARFDSKGWTGQVINKTTHAQWYSILVLSEGYIYINDQITCTKTQQTFEFHINAHPIRVSNPWRIAPPAVLTWWLIQSQNIFLFDTSVMRLRQFLILFQYSLCI